MNVVIDTNVLVSFLLFNQSAPGKAVQLALDKHQLLLSQETINELSVVLSRKKFDKYVSQELRTEFITTLSEVAEFVNIERTITVCRDEKDNKFLDIAANGNAEFLITGDNDLLVLNPFEGTRILTPSEFISL